MLKFIFLLGVLLLSSAACAETLRERIYATLKMAKLRRHQPRRSSCNVNLCFAIDGSDNLDPWQFRIQRDFVRNVVEDISDKNKLGVAAVQYGITNQVISPLTKDIPAFLKELAGSTFTDASLSFTGAGVVYCHAQLRDDPSRKGVMVLLGTGQWDLGGDPGTRADQFRRDGGEVIAVGLGDTDSKSLNDIASGRRNVFSLRRRREIGEVVDEVVADICG